MGWSRGLKLKLLLILLVGPAALAASLIFTFHIQEKQSVVIANLLSERVPLALTVGRTTTHLNEFMR